MFSSEPRYNNQQRAESIKSRRLDEHGNDGLVQSTDSIWTPHVSSNDPDVQDELDDDHEGEEYVEENRDR